MKEHWFWWLLTAACVAWYSTVTIYITIKGIKDIKTMLDHLAARQASNRKAESETSPPATS